jgi:Cupin domain
MVAGTRTVASTSNPGKRSSSEGELTVENGSEVVVLEVGDSAVVPPGAHHRYLSTSDLPCIAKGRFSALGSPRKGSGYGSVRATKVPHFSGQAL